MVYHVKTDHFEGPLDLLLSEIEKRRLPINEISLAKVTDDFISYIQKEDKFPMKESAHFILIASTLLLIKSKSLLPTLELSNEEQSSIEDLERRLKEYKRIKELSIHIRERFGKVMLFAPLAKRGIRPVFSPDDSTTIPALQAALKFVIASIPKAEKLPQAIVKKVISLEEMIDNLTLRVTKNLKMSFREFSGMDKKKNKINVIVSFLAMLELVRRGIINVTQESTFDDINIETEQISVPKYI